jgi:hypothetical protein
MDQNHIEQSINLPQLNRDHIVCIQVLCLYREKAKREVMIFFRKREVMIC